MFAFGLCVDERCLLPSLVTMASLADTFTLRARREIAIRVLTLDLTRTQAATMSAFVGRLGFGSFDLRWCRPPRAALMVDDAYITVTTYLRFEFTAAFVGRPYLVYVDADVLALDDCSKPLGELPDNRIGAVVDEFNPAVGRCPALPGLVEAHPRLLDRMYVNAGMLWAGTGMLPAVRTGTREAIRSGARFILHNDQDALNLWNLASASIQPIDGRFNRFELARFLERGDWVRRVVKRRPLTSSGAAALHFVGAEKPWLQSCPATEDVRVYRSMLRSVRRLAGIGVGPGEAR